MSQAARIRLTETSWNFFDALGVRLPRGRGFSDGSDAPGTEGLAVIGHGLWQQVYGGDATALGATIRVNGIPLTIVGIAPAGFDYPLGTAVWSPTVFETMRVPKTTVSFWRSVARLKDGMTWVQARQAFEAEVSAEDPERLKALGPNRPALIPLREELAGPVRQASFVLMAGAALLLLLACANIANFLLAHTLAREHELKVRSALGASSARLTQQLLTETVLLSIVAAAAGLAVAWWTTGAALAFQPVPLASQAYSVLDWQVLIFAMAVSIGTGLLFGAGPVVYVSRRLFAVAAKTASPARRHARLQHSLIVLQVAVTILLVTASASLGRTFLGLLRIDNGYALQSVATMSVSFGGTPYMGGQARAYEFTTQDIDGTRQIAIVNEEFARTFGGATAMVGRQITARRFGPWEIVGVVRGMRINGPLYPPSPQIFHPSRSPRSLTFVVRMSGPAKERIAALRDALVSTDARVPVFNVKTMDERLNETLARPKFYTTAVVFFGGLALLLSIVGVYGVVSFACAQRIRELGIRLALGTTSGRLRARLVWKIALLVATGAAVGSVVVWFGGTHLRELIPGAEAAMIATAAMAIVGTLAVAAIATWAATRRVANLDIMHTLRPD